MSRTPPKITADIQMADDLIMHVERWFARPDGLVEIVGWVSGRKWPQFSSERIIVPLNRIKVIRPRDDAATIF